MEHNEQAFRHTTVINRYQHFENLLNNEDFIKWRETDVLPHLEQMRQSILSIDTTVVGWQERATATIIAYQEVLKTYETLFNLKAKASERERKQLAQLGAVQG